MGVNVHVHDVGRFPQQVIVDRGLLHTAFRQLRRDRADFGLRQHQVSGRDDIVGTYLLERYPPTKGERRLIATVATMTFKSLRGKANRYTSPGCIVPTRPIAASTDFQSIGAKDDGVGVCAMTAVAKTRGPARRVASTDRLMGDGFFIGTSVKIPPAD